MLMQFQEFDAPYLERLGSGDGRTQEHFFAYFGELIRLKVSKRLRRPDDIDDVRQETFARVLRLLRENRIRQPERLGSFVNSVCNHVLCEHYRSNCREIPSGCEFVDEIPDPTLDPSEAIVIRELQQHVREILGELSEKDRRLMKAVFLEERDKDEVCQDFGVDRNYLRVLVHRAKQSFKSHYRNATSKARREVSSVHVTSYLQKQRTHPDSGYAFARRFTLQSKPLAAAGTDHRPAMAAASVGRRQL